MTEKEAKSSFTGFRLSDSLMAGIQKLGFLHPTPIQRKLIPLLLDSRDVVGMAKTGSGKTAAYAIPIVQLLGEHSSIVGCRAVIIVPTREVSQQVERVIRSLCSKTSLRVVSLIGGESLNSQFNLLTSNPDIIIATPGRLVHHMSEGSLGLDRARICVFDEADRLFELGFAEDITTIVGALPAQRQVALISATLPSQLSAFASSGLRMDSSVVRLDADLILPDSISLNAVVCRSPDKIASLLSTVNCLREANQSVKPRKPFHALVFVASRHHVDFFLELYGLINVSQSSLGELLVCGLYGTMDQTLRESSIKQFSTSKTDALMVVTDVAARGVDLPDVGCVIHYDFAASPKLFVHRCGRTGRMGKSGNVVSLLIQDDFPYLFDALSFVGREYIVSGLDAESQPSDLVIGSLPNVPDVCGEISRVGALVADNSDLASLHKSMTLAYGPYYATRPAASKSGVGAVSKFLERCGGFGMLMQRPHPLFESMKLSSLPSVSPGENDSAVAWLNSLRSFRPGDSSVVGETELGRRIQQVHLNKAVAREAVKQDLQGTTLINEDVPSSQSAKPLVVKKRKSDFRDPRFFLDSSAVEEPQMNGFSGGMSSVSGGMSSVSGGMSGVSGGMSSVNGTLSYGETQQKSALREVAFQMDLARSTLEVMPDEGQDMKKMSSYSSKTVNQWDSKKKRYVQTPVAELKKGKSKSSKDSKKRPNGSYLKKWMSHGKLNRVQKVGEMESASSSLADRRKGRFRHGDNSESKPESSQNGPRVKRVEFGQVKGHSGMIPWESMTRKQQRLALKRANGSKANPNDKKESGAVNSLEEVIKSRRLAKAKLAARDPELRKQLASRGRDAFKKSQESKRKQREALMRKPYKGGNKGGKRSSGFKSGKRPAGGKAGKAHGGPRRR